MFSFLAVRHSKIIYSIKIYIKDRKNSLQYRSVQQNPVLKFGKVLRKNRFTIARNTFCVSSIDIPSKFTVKVCDLEIFGHWRGHRPYVGVITAVGKLRKKPHSSWEINPRLSTSLLRFYETRSARKD